MEETGAKDYLDQLPMWANKKNSLKDIRVFLDRMGAPDRKIPAVHVAGTNGKGSVCAFMTSVLKKSRFSYRNLYFSSSGGNPGTFSHKWGAGGKRDF